MDFMRRLSGDVDIFCLQEVFFDKEGVPPSLRDYAVLNILQELEGALPEFRGYTGETQVCEGYRGLLTMFIRKSVIVEKVDRVPVYTHRGPGVNPEEEYEIGVQYARLKTDGNGVIVYNLHGHWSPMGKGDTETRIKQAENLKGIMDAMDGRKVLCGDFNMLPDIQSMGILEEGMRNLIKEYGITSTRSPLYKREVRFADYVLVSPEIMVKGFRVLEDVVSDHLPLYLEFS